MSRRQKKGRKVNGILLLDKPSGITSNQALQRVKKLFQARKGGHTGSLDKMATGLLPLCFGEGTKFSGYLLDADKHYQATIRLGRETTTGDEEGEIVHEAALPEITDAQLAGILDAFMGEIQQVPPMFSALKHQGKRLYELAYQGIEVERKPRSVTIYKINLQDREDAFFSLYVHCSKGTYIRTLAQDIGRKLGCGGCVHTLRRTGAGPFDASQMVTLDVLESVANEGYDKLDSYLFAIDSALTKMPQITVNNQMADFLSEGQAVLVANSPTSGVLRIYSDSGFLGLGEVLEDGRIAPRRLVKT